MGKATASKNVGRFAGPWRSGTGARGNDQAGIGGSVINPLLGMQELRQAFEVACVNLFGIDQEDVPRSQSDSTPAAGAASW